MKAYLTQSIVVRAEEDVGEHNLFVTVVGRKRSSHFALFLY